MFKDLIRVSFAEIYIPELYLTPLTCRKTSTTAARDIKQLIELGVLIPQEGKHRNVPYGIVISKNNILTPCPEKDEE